MALVHDTFSDFVLFPKDPYSYLDMLDARVDNGFDGVQYNPATTSNMQQHFSDLASTTYESYPSAPAYSSGPATYHGAPQFVLEAPKADVMQESRRWTPSGSPSPSVSQSYDHPPSAVSSVSGASGQSTASSAMGSPYSHATQSLPGQEQWTDAHLGLGIAVGTFHNDRFGNDIFPPANLDNDVLFEDGKYPSSFVGKSRNISSSFVSTSLSKPSAVSSSSSPSRTLIPAFHTPQLALDTSVAMRDVTIDTILEEVNSSIDASSQVGSPVSAVSAKASPIAFQATHLVSASPHMAGSFRAPTTPASALSSFAPRGFSPLASRQRIPRRHSTAACDDGNLQRSPPASSSRFHPYWRPILPPIPQDRAHDSQCQPPLFSQSSGRYASPLKSSCWFSLLSSFISSYLFRHLSACRISRPLAQYCFAANMIEANTSSLQIHLSSNLSTRQSCTMVLQPPSQVQLIPFTCHRTRSSPLHQHHRMHQATNRTGQDLPGLGAALYRLTSALHPTSHIHHQQRRGEPQ